MTPNSKIVFKKLTTNRLLFIPYIYLYNREQSLLLFSNKKKRITNYAPAQY